MLTSLIYPVVYASLACLYVRMYMTVDTLGDDVITNDVMAMM